MLPLDYAQNTLSFFLTKSFGLFRQKTLSLSSLSLSPNRSSKTSDGDDPHLKTTSAPATRTLPGLSIRGLYLRRRFCYTDIDLLLWRRSATRQGLDGGQNSEKGVEGTHCLITWWCANDRPRRLELRPLDVKIAGVKSISICF